MIGMDTRSLGIAELDEVPSVAVVVDVMRADTVAAWAFARGAEKTVLAESLDEALDLSRWCSPTLTGTPIRLGDTVHCRRHPQHVTSAYWSSSCRNGPPTVPAPDP